MDTRICRTVESAIPDDRSFTALDIIADLQASRVSRAWQASYIARCLLRLQKRGVIERLSRAKPRQPAVYAYVGLRLKVENSRTLQQVIDEVLVRPMTLTEIVTAVTSGGYVTKATQRDLRNRIARLLREHGFRREGDSWTSAIQAT